MIRKLVLIFAVLAVLVAGYLAWERHVYQRGYNARDAEAKRTEAAIKADALDKFSKATAEAREKERALQASLDASEVQRHRENTDHEKTLAIYRARVRSGDERLRVDVARCPVPGTATPTSSGATARAGDETRADLVPGIADNVLRIAADSARLVRDYNAVVDAYELARSVCNAPTN